MKLIFYIIIPARRKLRFDTAVALHDYIKAHKLPAGTQIELKEEDHTVGRMLVQRYLQLEKEEGK